MRLLAFVGFAAVSCSGGGGSQGPGPGGPGDTHVGDDLDTGDAPPADAGAGTEPTPGPVDGGAAVVPPPAGGALITFELKNSGTGALELNIDKGWGAVMFGYSGVPPKATSVVMFPRFCTAACDAPEADRCPKCEAPEDSSDESKLEQRVVIAPGKSHKIEWDGKGHTYQAVKKKCECYKTELVPPESYTLKVCGLRVTKSAGERTKQQCATQQVKLPPDKPTRVVFDFPNL